MGKKQLTEQETFTGLLYLLLKENALLPVVLNLYIFFTSVWQIRVSWGLYDFSLRPYCIPKTTFLGTSSMYTLDFENSSRPQNKSLCYQSTVLFTPVWGGVGEELNFSSYLESKFLNSDPGLSPAYPFPLLDSLIHLGDLWQFLLNFSLIFLPIFCIPSSENVYKNLIY